VFGRLCCFFRRLDLRQLGLPKWAGAGLLVAVIIESTHRIRLKSGSSIVRKVSADAEMEIKAFAARDVIGLGEHGLGADPIHDGERTCGDRLNLVRYNLKARVDARVYVTAAASALQRAGLIRYKRGNVTMIDRQGLKDRSCECYGVSKKEFDRLLGDRAMRKARSDEM
jgi:hypothetical protein